MNGVERCIDDEIPFDVPETWQWERWGNISQSIQFGTIRVMENYSGTEVDETIIQNEITNALAKFSMNISVLE